MCPTLCHLKDCSRPSSPVRGILHARILEWVAMPSSRGSSWPKDWTCAALQGDSGFYWTFILFLSINFLDFHVPCGFALCPLIWKCRLSFWNFSQSCRSVLVLRGCLSVFLYSKLPQDPDSAGFSVVSMKQDRDWIHSEMLGVRPFSHISCGGKSLSHVPSPFS